MKLLTKAIEKKLRKNAETKPEKLRDMGHVPVVKFFGGPYTALFTELDEDGDTLFGLMDLGVGFPELGYASLKEIASVKVPPFGLGIERDMYFKPNKSIEEYANVARNNGRIIA